MTDLEADLKIAQARINELEAQIADMTSDLHALMWYGDGCEFCAHKIVDERKPYRCLRCGMGSSADCKPLWIGFAPKEG